MIRRQKPLIIAIDGHAATGKSTQAKKIAEHYQITYIDSGAMYRAVTWYALEQGWIQADQINESRLISELNQISLEFQSVEGSPQLLVNGQLLTHQLRSMEVSQWVSQIAKIPEIRRFLVVQQQALGAAQSVVMDGRDIGTVVFPHADIKFYFTARAEIRAQRRLKELQPQQADITFEEVLANVNERDHLDSTRTLAPLKPSSDAHLIDVSDATIEEVFNQLCAYIDPLSES
ncbi:MAG: (d)CMP kinase [Flavobacteriaceae bacterium]